MKTLKILILSIALVLSVSPTNQQKALATGIPVFDAANAAQGILDYMEWLFQHAQMLKDTAREIKELEQIYLEWEWALERYRSLIERFGEELLDIIVEEHERKWGNTDFTTLITEIDPRAGHFIEAMTAIVEQYLGGRALEPEEVDDLLTKWEIEDEETKTSLRRHFNKHSNRQLLLQDSITAAAGVEARMKEYEEKIRRQADQIKGLEGNSDTAALQLIAQTNVMDAKHQLEIMGIMAKILANQNQETMTSTIDQIKDKEIDLDNRTKSSSRPL